MIILVFSQARFCRRTVSKRLATEKALSLFTEVGSTVCKYSPSLSNLLPRILWFLKLMISCSMEEQFDPALNPDPAASSRLVLDIVEAVAVVSV